VIDGLAPLLRYTGSRLASTAARKDAAMNSTPSSLVVGLAIFCVALLPGCGAGPSSKPAPQPVAPPVSTLTISTQSLADGAVGVPYSQTLQASGGIAPFAWTLSAGNLPHNLSLGASTANSVTIAGIPDTQQTVMFTIKVSDSSSQSSSQPYTVLINGSPAISVSISPSSVDVHVGEIQEFNATANNDASGSGVTWALSGCSGDPSICGNLSDSSVGEAWYAAPTKLSQPPVNATLTAASIADPTKSASAVITFNGGLIGFSSANNFAAGNAPIGVATGDFNGDGKLDLAAADNGDASSGDSGGVSILLGNGDGTFKAAVRFDAGKNPTAIAVADFNHDGNADLVVADLGMRPSGGNGGLSVLLGNGDGTFQAPIALSAGENPFVVAIGDFNRDGHMDIAVSDFGNVSPGDNGGVNILLGNGDGSFRAAVQIPAGINPVGLVARDFDGDGILDLAVADNIAPTTADHGGVSILLGNGDGTFKLAGFCNIPQFPTSITVAKMKSGALADLVVSSYVSVFGLSKGIVNVLSNDGAGGFLPAWSVVTGTTEGDPGSVFPLSAQAADFDGDGKQDAVEIIGSFVDVLPGNGDGTVEGPLVFAAGSGPFALTTGDFDGDGKVDVAVANMSGNDVSVLLNTSSH